MQQCTLKQIFIASTGESIAAMPLERMVIEGGLESADFAVLLSTLHPSFTGDVLFIDRPDHAFLSAMAEGEPRVLYTLSAADIEFYARVHLLLETADETDWELVSNVREKRLAERPMRVLVAESDPLTLRSVTSFLTGMGCHSVVARSGLEAIRLSKQWQPDVLLLEAFLPEARGSNFARFVKELDGQRQPRTIVLSKEDMSADFGVDGFLRKPVAFDRIADAVFGAAA